MKLVPHLRSLLGLEEYEYDYSPSSMKWYPVPHSFDMAAVYAAATVRPTLTVGHVIEKSTCLAFRLPHDLADYAAALPDEGPRKSFFSPVFGMPYGHPHS